MSEQGLGLGYDSSFDELCATLVHEIKNPLQLMKANLQLLQLSDKDNEYKWNYDIIYRQLDLINNLVENFWRNSKEVDTEKNKPFLDLIINDVINECKGLLEKEEVLLELTFQQDNIIVLINYFEIKRVLINIIKNSVEAMCNRPNKKIDILIKQEENNFCLIEITDNGIGIDRKLVNEIGKPFITTKETGSGLGLFISKKIIEDSGGKLEIISDLDIGTTVKVFLPEKP